MGFLIADVMAYMLGMLLAMQSIESVGAAPGLQNLVSEAAQGNADNVRAIVSRYPGQVCTIYRRLTASLKLCLMGVLSRVSAVNSSNYSLAELLLNA